MQRQNVLNNTIRRSLAAGLISAMLELIGIIVIPVFPLYAAVELIIALPSLPIIAFITLVLGSRTSDIDEQLIGVFIILCVNSIVYYCVENMTKNGGRSVDRRTLRRGNRG